MLAEIFAEYSAAREVSAPLPSGSAPYTSAHFFKIKTENGTQSVKPWDHHLSSECAGRTTSKLKAASRVPDPGAVISLGTARPAPQYYPWKSVAATAVATDDAGSIRPDRTMTTSCVSGESAYNLDLVLNYGYAGGSPQLLRYVTEHIEAIHQPSCSDWECALTCGTTSAIDIVLRMLCNRGESVLSEEFTYPGTIDAAKRQGLSMVGVEMDQVGLVPTDLDAKLRNWSEVDGPKPKVLYTIPSGQNPTGSTQTLERRKAIYEIAEQNDLLIVEDDPYYFIQLGKPICKSDQEMQSVASSDRYIETLTPSYLSLDTSGRVLRLDTTSKILAPGLRCGWITACTQLIQSFLHYTELSTNAPSGPSQMMLYKLLDESWGHLGFIDWLDYLSTQYRQRLKTLVAACEQFLPKGLCRWTVPLAGMFLWLNFDETRLHVADCGHGKESIVNRTLCVEDRIYQAARSHGVLVSKGSWFVTDLQRYQDVSIRLTFAAAADDDLKEAAKRLGRALWAEFEVGD